MKSSATFCITHRTVAFVSLDKRQKGTKTRRSSEVYIQAIAHIFPCSICSRIYSDGGQSERV